MRRYFDLKGNATKRTPDEYPYSYEPYVLWRGKYSEGRSISVFSDRMHQWDSEKFYDCCMKTWGNEAPRFRGNPKYVERFLSLYFGENITLTAIMEGCNYASGYPYWILFYERND